MAVDNNGFDTSYRVKLISASSLRFSDPNQLEQVVFEVTPTVSESRSVDYMGVTPVHMPGGIQVYKKTNARTFEVGAHLVSRNRQDATKNMTILQTLRGWTMPYFGAVAESNADKKKKQADDAALINTRTDPSGERVVLSDSDVDLIIRRLKSNINLLGAPPDVLYFYAYSKPTGVNRTENSLVNINRVPVVVTSLSFDYPEDVDYIPTNFDNKEPMPTKMDVKISLVETHSPLEYQKFSLKDFKAGKLANF